MFQRVLCVCVAVLLLAGCATDSSLAPNEQAAKVRIKPGVPNGLLGPKLGTPVIVEGYRNVTPNADPRELVVEKVGERNLRLPVRIWISNVEELPLLKKIVLYGYESGSMIGSPVNVFDLRDPQSVRDWEFFHFFVVQKVIDPLDVTFATEPAASK